MTIKISLLFLCLFIISNYAMSHISGKLGKSSVRTTIYNPFMDVSPGNAPDFLARVNMDNTNVKSSGVTNNIGNLVPQMSVTAYPSDQIFPTYFLISNSHQVAGFFAGTTYVYTNSTHAFATYYDLTTFDMVCYKISNFTFSKFKQTYANNLYRRGSYNADINLGSSIHDIVLNLVPYTSRNFSCELNVGYRAVDQYSGRMFDVSLPGPDSGVQKETVDFDIEIPRVLTQCYNIYSPVKWFYQEFYPAIAAFGIDSNNIAAATMLTVDTHTVTNSDVNTLKSAIDTLCHPTSANYKDFINSQCAYPSMPYIACGV